ncbi:MAG: gamma-glutamyl-gamma-aminobutyrate hydrolase family protein, partial [Bacteroidales bacterium]|nr:gamma-glutamyl-gamma-aminobutyrate hydrolase family protein [Bacteroidales bacterium]
IVNSLHHQAVKDIPQGFKVVAYSPDGVIEALERTAPLADAYTDGGAMIIGTQFHPEILVRGDDKSCRAIFRMLVEASK